MNNFSIFRALQEMADKLPPSAEAPTTEVPVVSKPTRSYDVRYMAGKCANGAHRDAGPLMHAVVWDERVSNFHGPALCGRSPKIVWSDHMEDRAVTCEKCKKKLSSVQ